VSPCGGWIAVVAAGEPLGLVGDDLVAAVDVDLVTECFVQGASRWGIVTAIPLLVRLEDGFEILELPAHAAADLVAELEDGWVADRVAGVVAILRAADHAGGVKDAEVL